MDNKNIPASKPGGKNYAGTGLALGIGIGVAIGASIGAVTGDMGT